MGMYGNPYNVSLKVNSKLYNGSDASDIAFVLNTFNSISSANTFDSDVADQNQIGTV
ncbi:spore germination protein [Bacillus sp. S14(2024)]|uniref:spore germination protein n=1 Tax=Bacillus sp. S14(2024) TaxID=3162884 RepID=UPI003D234A44